VTSTLEIRDGMRDPYPGPRPFAVSEAAVFFGRGAETARLASLVISHSLLLLYAPSGAGKTSLLRAGLIPLLTERAMTVFPAFRIRPRDREEVFPGVTNPFVRSMATNWWEARLGAVRDTRPPPDVTSLTDVLHWMATAHGARTDEPRILIIDQFEELFTQLPEHWELRGDLFRELQAAIGADPLLRVVLAIREDYVPQTDPFAEHVENHLQHRFRIERLDRSRALEAVTKPVGLWSHRFAPGAAEHLVDELLQIHVERDGHPASARGQFVEPVQLQIVCASLWERLMAAQPRDGVITERDVERFAPVDLALARFYGDVISRVSRVAKVDALELRRWCEEVLITPGGTRAFVYRNENDTAGLSNRAVRELETEHLIRGEERAGAHWFELSHDRFIDAITSGNKEAFEAEARTARQFDERWDKWATRTQEAVGVLRTGSDPARIEALNSLIPIALGSAPLAHGLRRELDDTLSTLVADSTADEQVRRAAEQVRSLAAVRPNALGDPTSPRRASAYLQYLTVSGRILVRDLAIIALGLVTSMIGITAATVSWAGHEFFGEAGRWYLVSGIALVWTCVYATETLDNFPLKSWRRSERQDVHTLTAPFAPYLGVAGLERLKLILVWPVSVLLPWLGGIGTAVALHELFGADRYFMFYLSDGLFVLCVAATYLAAQL
jgi:hypothetical protein